MNAGRNPLFVLKQDCQITAKRIIREVERAGMRALRTFDLEAVRSSNQGYCCPIHGMNACACQLVVLLILLREGGALTVILEGNDQQTSIYLDSGQGLPDEQVDPSLTTAFIGAIFPEKSLINKWL